MTIGSPLRRHRRPQGTPAVVFIDDSHWSTFAQLSPLLRRHGVRTIRITTEVRPASRVISSLLFDRHHVIPARSLKGVLGLVLSIENVIDVQFVEAFRDSMIDSLHVFPRAVAETLERRLALMDKMWASDHFDQCGIRVPSRTSIKDASPETVAEKYGFPVVVKGRVGCSGDEVRVVHEPTMLDRIVQAGCNEPESYYYEGFVHGEKLNYSAAVSPNGIEQEMTYRVIRWRQPVGSAEEVETIDDTLLAAFGRRAVEVAHCTGLVNMDVIRDDGGRDWLIDFNPRAFGGSVNFLSAGLDISEGYLCALGERRDPPSRRSPLVGKNIHVFPTCVAEVAESGKVFRTVSTFVREARPYLSWLGFRYWLAEAGVTAYEVTHAARRRRFHRAPSDLSPQ
jgi:hypothetical protein